MKTYLLLLTLAGSLVISAIRTLHDDPIVHFIFDGRPKHITYWNMGSRILHVDIEVVKPQIYKGKARFESMNIYFFPTNFSWMETFSVRYVKIVEM